MQITQCPECHTAFKVSPEHLAVANGWVRCGRCGAVFEAIKHPADGLAQTPTRAAESGAQDAAAPTHNVFDDFHDSLMNFAPTQRAGEASAHAGIAGNTNLAIPHTSQTEHRKESGAGHTATRQAGWWAVLSGVLGLVLVLQALLWNRNLLVAQEPALQGLIEGLCAPLGCEWHWPQTLDAVQIENSSFTENADGTYRLQLRLKNTQHHAVAMPLLELTLTDERDEVVLRRVFQPTELGLKDHLAALRDARSTLNFDLDDNLKPRVVGFRALIFYP